MPYIKKLIVFSVFVGITLLACGCGAQPIEIGLGDKFTNYNNQFRVLRAERFTKSHKSGDYIVYDEVIFILLEWKCLEKPGKRCTSGGYQFSLYEKTKGYQFENMTFKDEVMEQFNISIPKNAYNCCGLIDGGDTYQVYLLFKVGCFRSLVLRYPSGGESESGSIYHIELPDDVQCKR
jgi:hypothetical protein